MQALQEKHSKHVYFDKDKKGTTYLQESKKGKTQYINLWIDAYEKRSLEDDLSP